MLSLKPILEPLTVCQVADYSQVNWDSDFVFVGQTDEEKSLVCYSKDVPENTTQVDEGWSGFRIEGVLDFSLVGILAKISSLLAEEEISIFALSTYNTDYVLTKTADFDKALEVLEAAGYAVVR